MNKETYAIRANRDARARDLKERGAVGVRKRSARNQVLSPSWVEDWSELGRSTYPNGFGGCADTFLAALYIVEWDY